MATPTKQPIQGSVSKQRSYLVATEDGSPIETLAVTLVDPDTGLPGMPAAAAVASEAHIGQVGGEAANPSASFTRPADTVAYSVGDLVANSATAGSVAMMQFTAARIAAGSFMLRRAKVHKSSTNITNATFRLHLYRAPVTATNGDNGAWLTSGVADYLGTFDGTTDQVFADGACGFFIPSTGFDITVKLASGQVIYGLLEAHAAYTPASAEVFTVTLEDLQN